MLTINSDFTLFHWLTGKKYSNALTKGRRKMTANRQTWMLTKIRFANVSRTENACVSIKDTLNEFWWETVDVNMTTSLHIVQILTRQCTAVTVLPWRLIRDLNLSHPSETDIPRPMSHAACCLNKAKSLKAFQQPRETWIFIHPALTPSAWSSAVTGATNVSFFLRVALKIKTPLTTWMNGLTNSWPATSHNTFEI